MFPSLASGNGLADRNPADDGGWLTSATSKPEMVAMLGSALRASPERFFSQRLLSECRTFVVDERGRAGAAAGSHDDLVMAMGLGEAVRAEMLGRGVEW